MPASWMIGVEMLFYVIFPLSLLACSNLYRTLFVLAVSILLSTLVTIDLKSMESVYPSFVYHNAVSQLPYFIWGMAFFNVQRVIVRHVDARHARMICWALCAFGLAAIYTLYASSTIYMFFWVRGLRPAWDHAVGYSLRRAVPGDGAASFAPAVEPAHALSQQDQFQHLPRASHRALQVRQGGAVQLSLCEVAGARGGRLLRLPADFAGRHRGDRERDLPRDRTARHELGEAYFLAQGSRAHACLTDVSPLSLVPFRIYR
ncbi:hypothetical protein KK141_16365 [Dyella sp. LX-66]|uniref:hypothetical protein n=1 Tax=unclassified Dyella TaxID=2634549 RepID=UPI001BE03E20|nr:MULTISPECIES: hypothetical protein [unclassified Dyella]MBT2118772.1 hypothetical protein [Dyella sp. LX-1]MBT2141121.1 hypothetical protein [Dyella sp. LX-66]